MGTSGLDFYAVGGILGSDLYGGVHMAGIVTTSRFIPQYRVREEWLLMARGTEWAEFANYDEAEEYIRENQVEGHEYRISRRIVSTSQQIDHWEVNL